MARPAPSRKRPWGVLVPPTWPLDDFAFLHELLEHSGEDSSVAACLWSSRNALLTWAECAPEQRSALFQRLGNEANARERWASATADAPELGTGLLRFSELFAHPERPAGEALTDACGIVVRWAEERGLLETAIQFAEAAAAVSPDSPLLANTAARICRAKGAMGRAEVWYDRAVGLSRAAGDVLEYINAHLGFGALLLERRAFRAAQKKIRRAGTRARQQGMREQAAEAFHDALAVAIVEGDPARAAHFARRAADAYPRHAARYPAFGYDLAYLLTCCGMYRESLALLQLVVERIEAPADLIIVLGTLARAAAGTGERHLFDEATSRVAGMAGRFSHTAAAALYNVGEGARLLGEWGAAAAYADEASELARRSNSKQVLWLAATLRRAVLERQAPTPVLLRSDPRALLLAQLSDTVYSRLEAWRGPTWRPRRG